MIQLSEFDRFHTHTLKRTEAIDRIGENYAICALIIGLRDGPVSLLPGRIPDLQPELGAVDIHSLHLKVNPDGRHIAGLELVLAEPHEYIGLADSRVTDYDDLQQHIIEGVFGRHQSHLIINMEPNTDEFEFDELRLQLHNFHRMNKDFKQISFELFHIAVASYNGPIATLRDRAVQTELSLPEEVENNVVLFSNKGKILRKIPFTTNERVMAFCFNKDEILIIVLNNGSYYLADPFRSSSMK